MKTVADLLLAAHGELVKLETALREHLTNQNIADVLKGANVRLLQASQHPDAATELNALAPKPTDEKSEEKMPFG